MSAGIVFHLLAALAYAVLAVVLWRPLARSQTGGEIKAGTVRRVCLGGAVLLHGIAVVQSITPNHSLYLGWALAFSAAVWLGLLVFWLESFVMRIDGLLLILLPAATFASLLAANFPIAHPIDHANSELLRIHLLIALIAYGLITVAALQAVLMALLDRHLHKPVLNDESRNIIDRALDSMPPLLLQEVLLFRLIWMGFAVLTLTVITGAAASMKISGVFMPMDHKTVFTLLSWVTFACLLAGRHLRGWRGPVALRWTLVGFAFLLLSYTGSRFVLDVILHRA